ncbi:hypothetical protein A8B74_01795 [Sulfitobacter geojensis]|nr:hypothetical protein Z947_2881 [Sulfitobacter geojensis]OAN98093.1 hypothetical protein A8B74_01795 [Sulfitobacter geojensis]
MWFAQRNRRKSALLHKFSGFALAVRALAWLFKDVAAVDAFGGPARFLTQHFLDRSCPRLAQSVTNSETAPKADIPS